MGIPGAPHSCPQVGHDRQRQDVTGSHKTGQARLQALSLDAVGPLASILKESDQGSLTVQMAARMALRFIGNASVQMARERCKKAIAEMNFKLIELAEKDSIYEDASPMLFGDQFAKEAKEREDQLRCLDRASGRRIFTVAALRFNAKGAACIPAIRATVTEGDASILTRTSSKLRERKREFSPERERQRPP